VLRIRKVVDLPDPFGPTNPTTSPCSIRKDRESRARVLGGKNLLTPLASIMMDPFFWLLKEDIFSHGLTRM